MSDLTPVAGPVDVTATSTILVGGYARVVVGPDGPRPPANLLVVDRQYWQVLWERRRTADALWRIGEPTALVVMWSTSDALDGYVSACPTCSGSSYAQQVYEQPTYRDCPTCFGVGYAGPHGGVKALQVRPAVWTWDEEQTQWLPRGEVDVSSATVTTTGDVWLNRRDYVVRSDGNRWQVNAVAAAHLVTGFGTPSHVDDQVCLTLQVARDQPSMPSYAIEPTLDATIESLGAVDLRRPETYRAWEFADAPLEQR